MRDFFKELQLEKLEIKLSEALRGRQFLTSIRDEEK